MTLPHETIQQFAEAFERYGYLQRVAAAAAIHLDMALGELNSDDQALAAQSGIYDPDSQLPFSEEDKLTMAEDFEGDAEAARDRFDADIAEAVGFVGNYKVACLTRYPSVLLVDTSPAIEDQKTFLEFGTEDDDGAETPFSIMKFVETGKSGQSLRVNELDVTESDEAAVSMVITTLHKTLFRLTALDELAGEPS